MTNILLESVEYRTEETVLGTWKRYLYPSGVGFMEFHSRISVLGLPLLHYTTGISPETGRRKTAKGIIAVGRRAMGVIAIGQAALGLITVGQLAIGVLALGQAALGLAGVGQLAVAAYLGIAQLAVGEIAIGQLAYGRWVLAQLGFGEHVWDMDRADREAVAFFRRLLEEARQFLQGA